MMGLSDGRKSVRIGLAVLIQYRSVTDTQPATQPACHVAVAITLNAQASSLKTNREKVTLPWKSCFSRYYRSAVSHWIDLQQFSPLGLNYIGFVQFEIHQK